MWRVFCVAAVLLFSTFAVAEDSDAPEFLLGDLGVRVDLPKGWNMTRWSDWDFKAEDPSGPVLLFAWATDVQVPVGDDAEAWGPVFTAKVEELRGAAPKLDSATVQQVQGQPMALVDLSFTFGEGGPAGHLYGGTVAVEGKNFHLATVANKRFSKQAKEGRIELLKRLDIKAPATEFPAEITLDADGVTSKLPSGWREPLKSEMGIAVKAASSLGVEDIEACWLAMRPQVLAEPDVMLTCQGGLLLGVVDSYSFAGADELVRAKMFGKIEVPPAEMVELYDRVGFVYNPKLSSRGLHVGVVPYDKGVSRTWVIGSADDETLGADLRSVLEGSNFSGPHPASIPDQLSYWLSYRPFSPMVLCPSLCLLLGFGLMALLVLKMMMGKKNKYDLDDDDDDE
jgi:hypothetical protein